MKLVLDNKQNLRIVRQAVKTSFDDYPVLRDLSLAQAILEAGLLLPRPSRLALEFSNLFGMKPGRIIPKGTQKPLGIVQMKTTEHVKGKDIVVMQPFLANNDIEDSFKQHEMLFRGLSRYQTLFTAKTFEEAAQAVREAGYATDLAYTKKLISIYTKYIKE